MIAVERSRFDSARDYLKSRFPGHIETSLSTWELMVFCVQIVALRRDGRDEPASSTSVLTLNDVVLAVAENTEALDHASQNSARRRPIIL